ncbi:MAG: LD-carboxypeptidase [Thermodesulfobacteriota bacterium]|nr:LD-carboxypeptidase [Thermodesulfobacteriota bacterium]
MTLAAPILPPRLKAGDTIGVFHPAGPIEDLAAFESGLHILRKIGLQVRHHRPDDSGPDYLAACDKERVRELHTLWADDEVKALITARGGYGCLRIITNLDQDFLRSHPKLLIGFSDLTVLLNGIFTKTGLITLHGPGVTSLPRIENVSLDHFREQLAGKFRSYTNISGLEILRPTMGQGHLIGGNLTTLAHLIGTPWQPQFAGNILFLEDTAEPAYKLDRMLTHLSCCGLLDNLSGLILGVFDPGHDDSLEMIRLSEQIWNRVLELTRSSSYPIWGGFPAGHQRDNYPLPIGMEAVMDSTTGTLEFLPQNCLRANGA